MATTPVKQDSNKTGLRYAIQTDLRTLPGSPVWREFEPNDYSDFGGTLNLVARNPINASRQRKKGTIVGLDASGGFSQDLTMTNTIETMQGVMFATMRELPTNAALTAAAAAAASVTSATKKYQFGTIGQTFLPNALVYGRGFGISANNGLKTVVSFATNGVTVAEAVTDEAAPPASATLETCGHKLGNATSAIALNGNLVRLTDTGSPFAALPIIPGQWVYLGSDTASCKFSNNVGFARVSTVSAGYLEFDKVSWTPQAEAGTGKTIELYLPNVIRNELDPTLVKRQLLQLERTLGTDADGQMAEYLVGAQVNTFAISIPTEDKVTVDYAFTALDNEQRSGLQGMKPGTRPTRTPEEAINTSNDFSRISLSLAGTGNAAATPLFAYATELTINVNNNVSPQKAVGVLGAIDTTAGTFEVGGTMNVYFATVDALQAVRNNKDVTLDIIMRKANRAIVYDLPLLALGDGRLNIAQDEAIELPLSFEAAQSTFGHTMLACFFPYLPTAAS